VSHRNAPLTPQGRLLLCRRIEAGTPIAHVAAAVGISRRARRSGGIVTSSWARTVSVTAPVARGARPGGVAERVEAKICWHRRVEKVGPDRLAIHLDLPASTIYRVLVRHDLNRLSHMDRPTAAPIRRYERSRPGELVHVDVKSESAVRGGTVGPPTE
jgi:hypothetical protein